MKALKNTIVYLYWVKHYKKGELSMGLFGKKDVTEDYEARIAELEEKLNETKKQLALSEQEIECVNQCAHLGLWRAFFDDSGNQASAAYSDELRSLLGGLSRSELRDNVEDFLGLIHPEDLDAVLKLYTEAINDTSGRTKFNIDYRMKTKNGTYKWFNATGQCIRTLSGLPKEFIGSFHDIDELKQSEEAIRFNGIRRKALDRLMQEGTWSVDVSKYSIEDPESPCMYNRQCRKILGFGDNDSEFTEKVGSFASRVHPDDLHIALAAKTGVFDTFNGEVLDKEFRMKKKTGEYIWVRARNTVVYSKDKKPLITAGTLMDITQEKLNQLKFQNEMSPSIELLRKGIREISETVDMASAQMLEVANRQKEVTEAANGIEKSVRDSKTILSSIEGIASQTNLLSLNASIEAARVGEAGKGFAVVAKNVRELADSTKSTTEHIAQILNGMNDSVSDIQAKVKQIDESVEAEKNEMEVIDATIQQLYASADEIAVMAAELYK